MDKKKLAKYILAISSYDCRRAEDRGTLSLYLADAAKLLAKVELGVPLEQDIDNHERLWGQTFLVDKNCHTALYEKWSDFKNN